MKSCNNAVVTCEQCKYLSLDEHNEWVCTIENDKGKDKENENPV